MINESVYLLDGTQFAKAFNRVVHGGRGDYVEFEVSQIVVPLVYRFTEVMFDESSVDKSVDYYYYWLHPRGNHTKVYYQLRTVAYADYKVGKLYVSPSLLKDFKDPESLF